MRPRPPRRKGGARVPSRKLALFEIQRPSVAAIAALHQAKETVPHPEVFPIIIPVVLPPVLRGKDFGCACSDFVFRVPDEEAVKALKGPLKAFRWARPYINRLRRGEGHVCLCPCMGRLVSSG